MIYLTQFYQDKSPYFMEDFLNPSLIEGNAEDIFDLPRKSTPVHNLRRTK